MKLFAPLGSLIIPGFCVRLAYSLATTKQLFNFGQNPQPEVVFYWSISGTFVGGYDPSAKNIFPFRVSVWI